MKIAVTTPTGNIGSKLANILLDRKSDVTLIARRPEEVKDLASRVQRSSLVSTGIPRLLSRQCVAPTRCSG